MTELVGVKILLVFLIGVGLGFFLATVAWYCDWKIAGHKWCERRGYHKRGNTKAEMAPMQGMWDSVTKGANAPNR